MILKKRIQAWIKVIDTLKSCKTSIQLDIALEVKRNYTRLYGRSKFHDRIYKNMQKKIYGL
jgi:hypothetical protein